MRAETYNWLTLAAIVIGPIVAVAIAFLMESRRRDRDQKMVILRALMTTRHLPGDPTYSAAINLIPVEFAGNREIQSAYKDFIDAAYADVTEENRQKVHERTAAKQTHLIFRIATRMGFKIAETDLQTSAYAAQGWLERDALAVDSQKAMRDIAVTLHLLSRQASGATLTEVERQFLGLDPFQ